MSDRAPDPRLVNWYSFSVSGAFLLIAVASAWALAEVSAPAVGKAVPSWEYALFVGSLGATTVLAAASIPRVHSGCRRRLAWSEERRLRGAKLSYRGAAISGIGLQIVPNHDLVGRLGWWTGSASIGVSLIVLGLAVAIWGLSILTDDPPPSGRKPASKAVLGSV